MRKTILFIFVVCLSAGVMSREVSAQTYNRVSEKNIRVVKGKKLVVTGAVRDGDEVLYRFKARAGQKVTVKITGRDADFSVSLNHGLDVEPVANETKSWTGTMPTEFNGHCEIGVHSTYKVANYRLEISLN
jgi:hypothetical protein